MEYGSEERAALATIASKSLRWRKENRRIVEVAGMILDQLAENGGKPIQLTQCPEYSTVGRGGIKMPRAKVKEILTRAGVAISKTKSGLIMVSLEDES